MRIMVMMNDPDGLPRAWGIASTEAVAKAEAEKQLVLYKAKKREVGDPLGDAEYTTETKEVE